MSTIQNNAFAALKFSAAQKQQQAAAPSLNFGALSVTGRKSLTADTFTRSAQTAFKGNTAPLFGATLAPARNATQLPTVRELPARRPHVAGTVFLDLDKSVIPPALASKLAAGTPPRYLVGKPTQGGYVLTKAGLGAIQQAFAHMNINGLPLGEGRGETVISTSRPAHEAANIAKALGVVPQLGHPWVFGTYHIISDLGAVVSEVDKATNELIPVRSFPIPGKTVRAIERQVRAFNEDHGIAGQQGQIRVLAYYADGHAETTAKIHGVNPDSNEAKTFKPAGTEIDRVNRLSPEPTKVVLYLQAKETYGDHTPAELELMSQLAADVQEHVEGPNYTMSSNGYLEAQEGSKEKAIVAYAEHMKKDHGITVDLREAIGIGDGIPDAQMAKDVDVVMMGDSSEEALALAARLARENGHRAFVAPNHAFERDGVKEVTENSGLPATAEILAGHNEGLLRREMARRVIGPSTSGSPENEPGPWRAEREHVAEDGTGDPDKDFLK